VALGDPDQAVEAPADQEHELLRADPALRGQPFRQGREAGDVDRDERPFAYERAGFGSTPRPGADEPRQVRGEAGRRGGEGRLGLRHLALLNCTTLSKS
jgi:hypothetical protein